MNKRSSTFESREKVFTEEVEIFEGTGLENPERIAHWLDDLIRIPILNIRIGLDPILGTVPWLGDTVTAAFSIYLIATAVFYRVPKIVILRMALNLGIDYLLGIIPFIGDATDFFVKSNRWNMELLRKHARERRKPGFFDYLFVGGIIAALLLLIVGGIAFVLYALKAAGRLW